MAVLTYRVQGKINDGLAEAPPVEVEVEEDPSYRDLSRGLVRSWDAFAALLADELANDYGTPFGVGATLSVERIA